MYQPLNAVTGKPYQGRNVLILTEAAIALSTTDCRWATFVQAKSRGWTVRKGSKGVRIVAAKEVREGDESAERFYRHCTVFNAVQIEGIPEQSEEVSM